LPIGYALGALAARVAWFVSGFIYQ
ncbi:hypothetical protein Q604_UNBC17036G0001, partial [human gut metagenome]